MTAEYHGIALIIHKSKIITRTTYNENKTCHRYNTRPTCQYDGIMRTMYAYNRNTRTTSKNNGIASSCYRRRELSAREINTRNLDEPGRAYLLSHTGSRPSGDLLIERYGATFLSLRDSRGGCPARCRYLILHTPEWWHYSLRLERVTSLRLLVWHAVMATAIRDEVSGSLLAVSLGTQQ